MQWNIHLRSSGWSPIQGFLQWKSWYFWWGYFPYVQLKYGIQRFDPTTISSLPSRNSGSHTEASYKSMWIIPRTRPSRRMISTWSPWGSSWASEMSGFTSCKIWNMKKFAVYSRVSSSHPSLHLRIWRIHFPSTKISKSSKKTSLLWSFPIVSMTLWFL